SQGANLSFNRGLIVDGVSGNEVIFIGDGTGGIYVKNISEISRLTSLQIKNLGAFSRQGQAYTGALNIFGGTVLIEDMVITGAIAEDQLNIVNATIDVDSLAIGNANSDAFDCDFCKGSIVNFGVENIGGDGFDISGSDVSLERFSANYVNDKAVSVGE
ncbi:MAG: hypothetical protein VW270_28645, partial [Candidatus Poseidoniales archaeon]